MSSPSPGKRRMDTDVIKLYPCRSSWYRLLISRALVGKVTSHNGAFCTYPGVFFFLCLSRYSLTTFSSELKASTK